MIEFVDYLHSKFTRTLYSLMRHIKIIYQYLPKGLGAHRVMRPPPSVLLCRMWHEGRTMKKGQPLSAQVRLAQVYQG